jgi:uncharacterized protein (DUF2062 family)
MFERMHAWSQKNLPKRETFEKIRWLRPIAHRILLPELWRFNRRSVPRGVALGIVVGVMIPVAQTVVAALLALPTRANVPVAALTTFITNPVTTPPIWIAAYWLGGWILQLDEMTAGRTLSTHAHGQAGDWLRWLLSAAAPATVVGLIAISIVGALIGYLITSFGWRFWIAHKWRHRHDPRRRLAH